ncbi:MAG: hypothetical protein MJE68_30270, partial [Proteobacteria bacterium]|nr:hypothetical protein [Pseudomonadota bacterium]
MGEKFRKGRIILQVMRYTHMMSDLKNGSKPFLPCQQLDILHAGVLSLQSALVVAGGYTSTFSNAA